MAHAAMLHPMPPAINPMIIDNGPELPLSPDMTHLEAALKLAEEALAAVQTASGSDQCMTAEDFIKHGHACILPGLEYYRNLFIRTGKVNGKGVTRGELKELKEFFVACGVFDPLVLKDLTVAQAQVFLSQLCKSGFSEFCDPTFMADVESDLNEAMAEAKKIDTFDWSTIPGCDEYDTKLSATAQKGMDDCIARKDCMQTVKSWREDPIERARRSWAWWKRFFIAKKLQFWGHAMRLVVLVQPSSASIERAFSQLKQIVDACGETMLKETFEYRMLRRVNHGVY